MKRYRQKTIIFLILLLLITFFFTKNVFACQVIGSPWFKEEIIFDKNMLPPGVEVVENDPVNEPYALINENEEPFYIVKVKDNKNSNYFNSGIPEKYQPLFKLLPGQIYYWSSGVSIEPEGWIPRDGVVDKYAKESLEIDKKVYDVANRYVQVFEDNRPADVKLPEPQKFIILGYFKNKPVEISGTVFYKLNENYNPNAEQESAKICQSAYLAPLIVLFIGIVMLSGIVVVTLIFIRKKQKNK